VEEQYPSQVLVYQNRIYWAAQRVVKSADIDAKIVTTLVQDAFIERNAAINSSGLFWGDYGNIYKLPLAGGTPVVVVTEFDGSGYLLQDVTADESHLYWTTTDGFVKRGNLDGSNAKVLASVQDSPNDIVVSATHVYWTTVRQLNFGTSGIVRCDLDGQNLKSFWSGNAHSLTVSKTHAYWSDDTLVWQSALDGTNPRSIAAGYAHSMVADDSNVYWIGSGGSATGITRTSLAGGASTFLVVAQYAAVLAQDEKFLYYPVSNDNASKTSGIMRLAK